MPYYDVGIVGGGPAGAVLAMELARHRHSVLLVEARGQASGDGFKVGETLPPSANPVLSRLGLLSEMEAASHIRCIGNQSAWGSDQLANTDFIFDPNGSGWHLDRAAFDHQLREAARDRGAKVRTNTRVVSASVEQGWRLELDDGSVARCRWLADASGRMRWLSRNLGVPVLRHDRLVALAALLQIESSDEDNDARTLVESTPDGWWYTARLPAGARIVVFFTDADHDAARAVRDRSVYIRMLEATRHVRSRVRSHAYEWINGPLPRAAGSSRLTRFLGEGWLAVGDAAMTFDPLSSEGLLTAMRSAEWASQLISGESTVEIYADRLERAYEEFLVKRRAYYAMETRWADRRFWRSHGEVG